MASRRGSRGVIGTAITAAIVVFVFGGWWLYNGGTDGGIQNCWHQSTQGVRWLAEQGQSAWHSNFHDGNGTTTPMPTSTATRPAPTSHPTPLPHPSSMLPHPTSRTTVPTLTP